MLNRLVNKKARRFDACVFFALFACAFAWGFVPFVILITIYTLMSSFLYLKMGGDSRYWADILIDVLLVTTGLSAIHLHLANPGVTVIASFVAITLFFWDLASTSPHHTDS